MKNCKDYLLSALEQHRRAIDVFEREHLSTIQGLAEALVETLDRGGCIYICGNGGSAADSQHIAAELIGRFQHERRALAAVALTTDSSVMSSIGNDYEFDKVFTRQVEALVSEKDLLWCISTSGSSPNIVEAAKLARSKGARTAAFTGRKESVLENVSDICLCAECDSTARAQEIHQLAYHIICGLVENEYTEKNN